MDGRRSKAEAAPGPIGISLQRVTLRYGHVAVLRDLTLTIAAGENVAIVGRTGAGKSSLLSACLGLYAVEHNKPNATLFNSPSSPLHFIDKDGAIILPPAAAYGILQSPFLQASSLRSNLYPWTSVGESKGDSSMPSDAELWRALDMVGLSPRFKGNELGLEVLLSGEGEQRGQVLSLGERQLLALARCLLCQPG